MAKWIQSLSETKQSLVVSLGLGVTVTLVALLLHFIT
jgi:hypothetical protein